MALALLIKRFSATPIFALRKDAVGRMVTHTIMDCGKLEPVFRSGLSAVPSRGCGYLKIICWSGWGWRDQVGRDRRPLRRWRGRRAGFSFLPFLAWCWAWWWLKAAHGFTRHFFPFHRGIIAVGGRFCVLPRFTSDLDILCCFSFPLFTAVVFPPWLIIIYRRPAAICHLGGVEGNLIPSSPIQRAHCLHADPAVRFDRSA